MRKGIILLAARDQLYPVTQAISKQLLPVYDKPMIYYPLSTLMLAGIRDIPLISTPDATRFAQRRRRARWGVNLLRGPAVGWTCAAFLIGRSFIGGDAPALVLGDNIFCNDLHRCSGAPPLA
jgi:glucose-1-phosphate thymidylyltransferase